MHLIKSQKSTNTSKFQQDFSRKGPSWLFVPVVLFRLPSVDCVWWEGRRGFYTASIDQNFPPSSQQQVNCFVHTDSVWPDHRDTKRGSHTVTQYRDDLLKGQYSFCEDLIYICFLTRAKIWQELVLFVIPGYVLQICYMNFLNHKIYKLPENAQENSREQSWILQQLSGNLLSFAIIVFCDADYVVLCCLRSLQNLIDS